MNSLRPEEEWARLALERELRVPVVQHDDGTIESTHDLEIRYPHRQYGAVEVTAAADPDCIALWKLINGADGRWIEQGLDVWMVSLRPTARAKRVRKELPGLLSSLEALGRRSTTATSSARPSIEQAAATIGVASPVRVQPTTPDVCI